ncbi:hypothetical protein BB778_04600 [Pluralibacter gergoviae]|nr:hypothetical protein BB778_04600 [Pluralibacter gergoviae]
MFIRHLRSQWGLQFRPVPCLNDSPTKSGVIRSDDEAAAQASGAVITHGANANTERKRDGSKRGGGSANGGGGERSDLLITQRSG